MPGAFLRTASPSGVAWEQVCRSALPTVDPNGFVSGPWGELLHWAVVFEKSNNIAAMPEYSDNGPAGQVLDFLVECGFSGFTQALEKNEQATQQALMRGDRNFVFQQGPGFGGGAPAQMGMGGGMGMACMGGAASGQPLLGGNAPQQQMMGGLQHVNPYKMLESLDGIHIVEKMNMMETASGLLGDLLGINMELEMANKYLVTSPAGHPLFFAVENTGFLHRQFGGDCRGIDVDVVVLGQDPHLLSKATGDIDWSFNPLNNNDVDLNNSEKFLKLQKNGQCTCCCFNRPVVNVMDGKSGELLGRIKNPWRCCDMTFDLEDSQERDVLSAKGGCCQLGLICPCPCGPCKKVNFGVSDVVKNKKVGNIKKVIPDPWQFMLADDVDNYEIEFGKVKDAQWKAMLLALSLFIDFRFFNSRSEKNEDLLGLLSDDSFFSD